jgi:hypothetical protein
VVLVDAWVVEVAASAPPVVRNHARADLLGAADHAPHPQLLNLAKEVL